jgi:hypothetical protein
MRIKFTLFAILTGLLFFSQNLSGQTVGDYRSASTGEWTVDPANRWDVWDGLAWQNAVTSPVAGDGVITILSTHTITVGVAPVTADQIVVAAGGTLAVNNVLTVNDGTGIDLEVDGTLTVNNSLQAGTGTPSAQIDNIFDWTGGTLGLPTNISVGATLNILGANKALATILTNNGTINWSAAQITFNNGTLDNNSSFAATGATSLNNTAGTNLFRNDGTFTKSTAATVSINIPFINAGALNITGGVLNSTSATGTFSNTGSINFSTGSFTISGSLVGGNLFDVGSTVTGTGSLSITSSTTVNTALVLPSTVNFVLGGTAANVLGTTLAGSLSINGAWDWPAGTLALPTTIQSTGVMTLGTTSNKALSSTLTNLGTINWTGFNLPFSNGTLINQGSIVASGDNTFSLTAGTNLFDNTATGTFTKSTGTGSTTISIPVSNAGTFNITTGTFVKGGATVGFTNSGTINVAAGAVFTHNSGGVGAVLSLEPGTTLTGSGTFRMNANTAVNLSLTIPATLTTEIGIGTNPPITGTGQVTILGILNWGNGTVSVPMTIAAGATMNSTATKTMAANLTNNGTINLSDPVSGNVGFTNSTFTNNGTINDNFSIANRVISGSGASSFVNNGIYIKNSNAATTTFSAGIPVTNNSFGRIAGTGTISFSSISNDGFLQPGGGAIGILTLSANTINQAGNSPTVRISIQDGSGPGTGHDQLVMLGTTTLTNVALVVDEADTSPLQPYVVMTAPGPNGFVGTFASVLINPNYTVTIDNASNPSTVTLTKINSTLPLVWGKFTALATGNKVSLDWSTLQEENTSHFIIEHSQDGRNFTTIANVPAKGNSSVESFYSFSHISPNLTKSNIYRIRQVDIDGRATYSDARSVRFSNGSLVLVQASPNPVRNTMQLSIQQDVHIVLSNAAGSTMRSLKLQAGVHNVQLDNFPAGVYQLTVYKNDQRVEAHQIIKL